ncbi:MAG: hypothetical protein AB1627_03450 [Chloroflexota bacterium]
MRRCIVALAVLAAVGVLAWISMEPSERMYLKSIARQLKELPGRYAV